jgi:hypothetical protein
MVAALCVTASLSIGCIDAGRVNRECHWTDTSSGPLNLDRAADREHLRQDAQVAWEVGQRYADVRYRTRPQSARPLLDACRSAMVDSIVARHAVTPADVERATHARRWPVDIITVFLPMLVVAILVALFATREVERLTRHDSASAIAQVVLIAVVALITTGLMQIWAMSVETWRLRNEHLAGRFLVIPSVAHPAIAVTAMIVVVAATLAIRTSRRRAPAHSIS